LAVSFLPLATLTYHYHFRISRYLRIAAACYNSFGCPVGTTSSERRCRPYQDARASLGFCYKDIASTGLSELEERARPDSLTFTEGYLGKRVHASEMVCYEMCGYCVCSTNVIRPIDFSGTAPGAFLINDLF
jgi:hypothetical protein